MCKKGSVSFFCWRRSRRDRWGDGRGQTARRGERHLQRLLAQHQARGKSNQAISKPRRSAPATVAAHNYNTIWQRYWAPIPLLFLSSAVPLLESDFYRKGPKMALAQTYRKERGGCGGSGRGGQTSGMCWLSTPGRDNIKRDRRDPLVRCWTERLSGGVSGVGMIKETRK